MLRTRCFSLLLSLVLVTLLACTSKPAASPSGTPFIDDRPLNTPSAGTPVAAGQLGGLFSDPKPTKVTSASLATKPESAFQPHDRRSVVIYDTQTGKETNFGPGTVISPAFGGNKMVFTAANEGWVVDLGSMSKTSLGPANLVYFVDQDQVVIVDFQSRNAILDLRTGTRVQASAVASSLSDTVITDQETSALGGPLRRRLIEGGHVLRFATDVEKTYRATCQALPQPESGLCGARLLEEYVIEDKDGGMRYQFRAGLALPAGPNEIILATSPRCDDGGKQVWCEEVLAKLETQDPSGPLKFAKGTTNLFLVHVISGRATFIATARYDPPTRIRPFNWPLSADGKFVTWTESYCGQEPHSKTRIYDRKTGNIRELDASVWVRLQAGLLGTGEFGAKALIDPVNLQYKTVLPHNLSDVLWSPDLRYAATGSPSGHGGLCG